MQASLLFVYSMYTYTKSGNKTVTRAKLWKWRLEESSSYITPLLLSCQLPSSFLFSLLFVIFAFGSSFGRCSSRSCIENSRCRRVVLPAVGTGPSQRQSEITSFGPQYIPGTPAVKTYLLKVKARTLFCRSCPISSCHSFNKVLET